MQFALNYSPPAAALLSDGVITIDRFKCPDWDDLIAEAQQYAPVYVHFPVLIGGGRIHKVDWAKVERQLAATDTPYLNTHLYPQVNDFPDAGLPGIDGLTPAQIERVTAQIHADLAWLVERFGAERVLVENVPYRAKDEKNLRVSVEPSVISAAVEAFGVGFLFDISHACIAAGRLGWNERAYIEALPLERTRELHITGIATIDGERTDHLHMSEADWAMLTWTLDHLAGRGVPAPWIAAFEYGGISPKFDWRSDPDKMRVDVPRMTALLNQYPHPAPKPG